MPIHCIWNIWVFFYTGVWADLFLLLLCLQQCHGCLHSEWLSGLANSAFLSLCVSVSLDLCFSSLRPAMQQVLDNVGELPTSAGAKDIDLLFLRGIMESPIVRSLAKVAHTHSSGQAAVSRQTTSQLQAPPHVAPSNALLALAEALKYSKVLTNTQCFVHQT